MEVPEQACEEPIYHFTRGHTAFGGIMWPRPDHLSLRLNAYRNMRDPFEEQAWDWRYEGDYDARRRALNTPGAVRTLTEKFNEAKGRAKILSMTRDVPGDSGADDTIYGHARARLWEHYADQHRGVCLVFERRLLKDLICDQMSNQRSVCVVGDVVYSSTIEQIVHLPLIPTERYPSPEGIKRYLEGPGSSLFFRKLPDWESEGEVRILCVDDTRDSHIEARHLSEALVRVIIGPKFPTWQIPAARLAVKQAKRTLDLTFIHWSNGKPSLRTEPDGRRRDDSPNGYPGYVDQCLDTTNRARRLD